MLIKEDEMYFLLQLADKLNTQKGKQDINQYNK